jgi:hypothetical protein
MNAKKILWGLLLSGLALLSLSTCKNPLTTVGLGSKVDILPPGIRIIPSAGVQNGAYVRGAVTIVGESSDDAAVASVSWRFTDTASGAGSSPSAATLDSSKKSWNVVLNTVQPGPLFTDGEKDFVFTVTDESGKTADTRMLLIFDNTAPTASFVSPQNGATIYNQVTIRGSGSDNTRLERVELRIGKTGTGSGDGFFAITGSLYDWSKDFLANDYANLSQANDRGDGTWDLPIFCRVYDVAGNIATNEPSSPADPLYPAALVATYGSALVFDPTKVPVFNLVIDLDRDKPTITIQTPKDGSNTAGTVAVSGTCFDENPGMDKVEIQISALRDDDSLIGYVKPDGSAVVPASSWIVVPWTGGQRSYWQQNINENEKLYNVGAPGGAYPGETLHHGRIQISVRPTDLGGKVGNVQTVKFRLDNSIPRLENPRITLNGADVPAQDYLYAKGTIRFKAKARDDQAVTSIRISLDGGSSYGSDLIGSGYVTQNAVNDFDIDYPIDTLSHPQIPPAILAAKCGLLTIGVKIQDNTTPAPYANTWFVTVNLDNLFPAVSYTGTSGNGHDPMALSGNKTSSSQVMGTSLDSGSVSGIDKIEVYLARNSGTKVIDLTTGSLVNAESAPFGDPPASAPYTTSPNCEAVIDWTKIGVIDNMALIQNGSNVDWWAKLDSTLIADGSVDIHFVAWDKAGNAVHGMQAGFIKNKVPVISSVSVGTDLNANGLVDAGEITTYNPASPITARNDRLYIRINTTETGYNIPFSYSIKYAGSPTDATNYSDASGVAVINSAGKFGGDGNGKVFTVSITDLVGITVQQDMTVNIRNTDAQAPIVGVNPISAPADLLDWNSIAQPGHIESAAISRYDNAGTTDADVSGTVMVRGTAHDNVRIDAISLSIDGGAAFQVAHWGASGLVADVADFHIATETLSDSGHDVTWDYKWDTSTITTVAKNNVVLSFTATDHSANPSTPGTRQYDVVPYITQLDTAITGYISKDFNRSALGKYPVRTGETITIKGYNLKAAVTGVGGGASDVRIVGAANRDNASKTGRGLSFAGVASPYTSMTATVSTIATDASIGSGYLVVWVNGVPSINALSGRSNAETNFVSASGTDERWLTIWDRTVFKTTYAAVAPNANHAAYPSMLINANTPLFAYVNNVQGYGLAEYWNGTTETKIYENWDLFTFTALGLNGAGLRAALYDINVCQTGTDFVGDKGGITVNLFYNPPDTTWNGTTYYFRDYNVWLDNLYKTGNLAVLDRYQFPDIKIIGDGARSSVFFSVYDRIDDKVIFRSFRVGTDQAWVGSANRITDGTVGGSPSTSVYTNLPQYNQNNTFPTYVDASGTNNTRFGQNNNSGKSPTGAYTVGTGTGNWTAVAATSGGVALVVYYDVAANQLKYVYHTSPDANGNGSFSSPIVLDGLCGGDFVDMVVDSADHIHIAYHDSYAGDLKYVYLDTYASAPSGPYVVDSYLNIGNKAGIAVSASGTPYITCKGMGNTAKAAWLVGARGNGVDGSDKFNGTWEVQVLPTSIIDNDTNRFCIGVDSSSLPVVGYTNDGIEYIRRLADLP